MPPSEVPGLVPFGIFAVVMGQPGRNEEQDQIRLNNSYTTADLDAVHSLFSG